MTPTTYGYENPDTGDLSKGSTGWMAQINFDIARLDAHSHNGIDSVLLNISSFATQTVNAPAGSWVANSGGSGLPSSGYKQTVTAPVVIGEVNNYIIKFLVNTAGATQYQELDLFYTRASATTITIYCSDNSIAVLCVFR